MLMPSEYLLIGCIIFIFIVSLSLFNSTKKDKDIDIDKDTDKYIDKLEYNRDIYLYLFKYIDIAIIKEIIWNNYKSYSFTYNDCAIVIHGNHVSTDNSEIKFSLQQKKALYNKISNRYTSEYQANRQKLITEKTERDLSKLRDSARRFF